MISISEAYTLLELPSGANEAQVRSAFRKLALQWHPDRNKDPNATDRFVRIHEAYDVLIHRLTKGKKTFSPQREAEAQSDPTERPLDRARRNARMRYEDYLNSDQFQQDLTHESFNKFFGFLLSILLVFGLPAYLYFNCGKSAIPATIAIVLITSMLWLPGLRNIQDVDLARMKGNFLKYYFESLLAEVLLLIIPVAWLAAMCFRIFVSPYTIMWVFISFVVIAFGFIFYFRWRPANKSFMAIGLAAITLATFFSLNSIFGYNLRQEKLDFEEMGTYQAYKNKRGQPVLEEWPLIVLPNDLYKEYPQIRFCINPSEVEDKTVTYIIGNGLFGIDYLSEKHIGSDTLFMDY